MRYVILIAGDIIILGRMIPTALTIAGSDPSGGAGVQADLKTFSALKVYGMSVIAALTAQSTLGVREVMEIPAEFVGLQLDAVLSDIPPAGVKTGMLGTAAVVEVVARKLREYRLDNVVVDPVMVSSSGTPLLEASGVEMLKRSLLPAALLVTPNLAEAAALGGMEVRDVAAMEEAARRLHGLGARHVLVKGGHLEGDAIDVFFDGARIQRLSSPRIRTTNLHGTGCVLSAAVAAYLSLGRPVFEAVVKAKEFVTESIRTGLRLGGGAGPVNPGGCL
jgi:hydroxymethylpyrimidine/phosphomethylpyrimidine kinase